MSFKLEQLFHRLASQFINDPTQPLICDSYNKWTDYIPWEYIDIWGELSIETRQAIFIMAQKRIEEEEMRE